MKAERATDTKRGALGAAARGAALALSTLLVAVPAAAAPCDVNPAEAAEAGAPARLTFGPGNLGGLPEACPATDSALQGFASLLVAVDDFYGYLDAGLAPRFRRRLSRRDWITIWLPPLEYRFSANATVEASHLGVGAASFGYHHLVEISNQVSIAPYARVIYPSDTGYQNATLYGFEHGISAVARLEPRLELVGGLALPLWLVANATRLHATYVPHLDLQAILTPKPWFALALGAGARLRSGNSPGFESFDPEVALRFYPWRRGRVELAAATPLWGGDRTDVLIGVNLGWVFER